MKNPTRATVEKRPLDHADDQPEAIVGDSEDDSDDNSNGLVVETLPALPITPEQLEQLEKEIDEAYDRGDSAELVVVDVSESSNIQKYNEKAKNKVVGIYNTKLLYASVEITPDKPLNVTLPIPEGANPNEYDVFQLMEDGTLKKVEVKSADAFASASKIEFEALELGNFVICERSNNASFNVTMIILVTISLCLSGFILLLLFKKKKNNEDEVSK